jgi:TRAP-type C4-dicarboxylate transport system permease small subunit
VERRFSDSNNRRPISRKREGTAGIEYYVEFAARAFNWLAAGSVTAMMFLTVSDVVLRLFRHPVPGTYEIVGFLGAVFVSFSLAYTSVQKGHIAVEFLVEKLSGTAQRVVELTTTLVCALLFAAVSWQSVLYGDSLRATGEVSLTVQIPLYPFVYGMSVGCGLLSLVLFMRCFAILRRLRAPDNAGRTAQWPGL